ncbi:hypothetical protein AB6A40_006058 [Gnathostoma spinigerum]|uniref:Uncharacterized protein n=1 Tax=Gnathostoma spinigerum TaxID=75299 RepID=A0ABD6EH96_9BILA
MTTTNIGSESNATVDHDPSFSDDEDFEVIGDVPPDSPSPDAVKNNNENAVITSGSPLFLDALNSITSSSQISSEANTSSDVLPETISIWAVPQETGLTSVVAKSPSKISSKEETKEELCQANVLSNTLEASTVTIRECDDKAEGLVEKKEEDDRFLEMLQELDAIKKELECARSALAEKDTQKWVCFGRYAVND